MIDEKGNVQISKEEELHCNFEGECGEDCCVNPLCEESSEKKIEELEETIDFLEKKYLRAVADAENIRRRCTKDIEDAIKFSNSVLAKDIIEFIDNLERAIKFCPVDGLTEELKSFAEGINITVNNTLAALKNHGIEKIETDGLLFNPELHQAVSEIVSSEGIPSGNIVETLQTGYTINGRLLRAALVVVAK
ncbi:MAG: nucleotide exchange factor GrpE [Holosporales bacterium]|jgi:molecular chaperone GrpE|nr:nucleotide exchange factor GrpE [Holosporales bacterium]